MKRLSRLLCIAALLLCSGCMSYSGYPTLANTYEAPPQKNYTTLYYSITGDSLFAGPTAIRNVIATEAPFRRVEPTENGVIKKGSYLSVSIEQNSPTLPAVVFGYLSYATLTILPFWSTNDGATITFSLYKDGIQTTAKDYTIKRGTFVWILMAPLVWVNLFNSSEEEAFEAVTRDFLRKLT